MDPGLAGLGSASALGWALITTRMLFDALARLFYSPPVLYDTRVIRLVHKRFPPRVHPPRPIYHPVTAVFVGRRQDRRRAMHRSIKKERLR